MFSDSPTKTITTLGCVTFVILIFTLLQTKYFKPFLRGGIEDYSQGKAVQELPTLPTHRKLQSSRPYYIAFIGDSLVEKPRVYYNLFDRIQALLPEYNLKFASFAQWGFTINDVLGTLDSAIPTKPDAYFLLWDSDISNYTPQQDTADARRQYMSHLTQVIQRTTADGAYLAVAGPGLLGEGMVLLPSRFWQKQGMLNDYREMNQKVCKEHGIDYVDVRKALLDELPFWHLFYKGWVTVDGEHESERGAVIISKLIADCLRDNWLSKIT